MVSSHEISGRGKFIEGRPVQKEETLQQHDRSHIGLWTK